MVTPSPARVTVTITAPNTHHRTDPATPAWLPGDTAPTAQHLYIPTVPNTASPTCRTNSSPRNPTPNPSLASRYILQTQQHIAALES